MTLILKLGWYFIIFSFLGWAADSVRSLFSEKRFYNKGFLASPFCPSYGACAVVMYVLLRPFPDNPVVLFIASTVIMSLIFILIGFLLSKLFGFKPWDFSGLKLRIGSYMTLLYALLLGLAGTIFVSQVAPVIDSLLVHIPDDISIAVIICYFIFILIDFTFSLITVIRLKHRIASFSKDAELLKEGISEEKLSELKENYNKLFTENILRKRLTAAFPELKKRVYIKEFAGLLEKVKSKNMLEYTAVYDKKDDKPFAFGFCFTKLFYLFVVGSLAGTLIESVWALFSEGHFEFRVGMVYGPFIPVYGGGACLLTAVLYKLYKLNDTFIFVISAILGAAFEYACSWFQETLFGTVSWDYSGTPFNLNGRTNLMYALIWGFLGLVWVRYLYPWISKLIEKIPKRAGSIITTFLIIFMIFNSVMSASAVWRWNNRSDGVQAQNAFERYLDKHFDDDKMTMLFPHMKSADDSDAGSAAEDSSTPDSVDE